MEHAPRLQRKVSLSLGQKLQKKRHSASPLMKRQQKLQTHTGATAESTNLSKEEALGQNDANITPKKGNLNNSIDYSPHMLDTSLSPSFLCSQTLHSDTPEVVWSWSEPKSESYKSASHSKASVPVITESYGLRRFDERRKEEKRRCQEHELRRAQLSRINDMLKQRCERLHKRLEEKSEISNQKQVENVEQQAATPKASTKTIKNESPVPKKNSFDDFFNDSDTDCLLLQATQNLECEKSECQENVIKGATETTTTATSTNTITSSVTTPKSSNKEKRTSFYMKFLEEETPEEWLAVLDDAVLQETQSKKARTSLHRYNSMPTNKTKPVTLGNPSTVTSSRNEASINPATRTATTTYNGRSLKRHASSHVISPIMHRKLHTHAPRRLE